MASWFLFIFVAACVALIANRQWELDAALKRNFNCTQMIVDSKQTTGKCGQEELKELKTCRIELRKLLEVKGKCLVYEKNLKEHNSEVLIKQADDLMRVLSGQENLVAKEAERKDMCEKHLRNMEVEARQLVNKIVVLVREKEDCNTRYQTCTEQLGTCTAKL